MKRFPRCLPALAKAFTLVELLVVIAIIAVLVVIMVPVYQKALTTSYEAGCVQNLGKWGQIVMQYISDNSGYMPPTFYNGSTASWINDVDPYMNIADSREPHYAGGFGTPCVAANPVPFAKSIYFCPQQKVTSTMATPYINYAMNIDFEWSNNGNMLIKYASIAYPSEYCLMSDCSVGGYMVNYTFSAKMNGTLGPGYANLTTFHYGYPNFLYGDMHVASFRQPLYGLNDAGGKTTFYAHLWRYTGHSP